MEVRCDKCQARYRVDDARIGPQGLTMRCGKCQNTFKVTRDAAAAPAAKPAAAEAPAVKPAAPRPPSAPKPAAPPPAAAPADEGAGRTMMFQTGNLKTPAAQPPAKPAAPKAAAKTAGDESGSTMVFGQSPIQPQTAAKPAAPARPSTPPTEPVNATMVFGQAPTAKPAPTATPAKPAPAATAKPAALPADDGAGSTMMFGQSPLAKPPAPKAAAPAPAPRPAAFEARPQDEDEAPTTASEAAPAALAEPDEREPEAEPMQAADDQDAEGADVSEPPAPSAFDKAPPKALLIGVAAGLGALILAGVGLVAFKKLGPRPPPPAAVEALAGAQASADKDTLPSIADAEARIKEAIETAGPRVKWPQSTAALAEVEVQWADALNDTAALLTAGAAQTTDDAKKADAETRATKAQDDAKVKLKSAFDLAAPALRANPKSPDLELALADYYRAQRSTSNMNRELKKAQALKAEDARLQFVQGAALAQDDDSAEKAVPRLQAALAANPSSARLHFRMAMAYLALKDEASARKELEQTLKLSPEHDRAKLALEQLAAPSAAK